MSIADNPILAIIIGVIFVVLFIWANRCSSCGKLFTCELRSRSLTSEGYRSSWKYDNDSKRAKHVRSYSYSYRETYTCSKCGHSYSRSTSSSHSLPCGSFLSAAERKAQAEAEPAKPRAWYNPLRWLAWLSFKKVLWGALILVVIFFSGFIFYDTEVFTYPSHFQDYLEDYVEFLLDPFSDTINRRTRLEVVSGSWLSQRYVYEYKRVENENWIDRLPEDARVIEKTVKMRQPFHHTYNFQIAEQPVEWAKYHCDRWVQVDILTASGTDLPVSYPDNPCKPFLKAEADDKAVGEVAYGTREAESTSVKFFVTLREISTGITSTKEAAYYMRVSDRDFEIFNPMREADYRYLMEQRGKTLTARMSAYSLSDINFWVYVDAYPQ